MPGVSIPNLAGAAVSPLLAISEAMATAPVAAAEQNAALEQKGWQTIQPFIIAASRNPNLLNNSAFVSQLQRTAQQFRIAGPLIDQAIQQTRQSMGGGEVGMQPQQAQAPVGGAQQTGPAQAAPAAGGGATQTGPAQPDSGRFPFAGGNDAMTRSTQAQGGTSPQLGQHWDDPKLQAAAQIYQQDLEAAARTPRLTGHPSFIAKLKKDGMAVGRQPSQIAADIKAAQVKAGVGPHPETMPDDQAQIRQQRQQALQGGQPALANSAAPGAAPSAETNPASQSLPSQGGSSQPQASSAPVGAPGTGATGPQEWTGPHALPPAMQALMAAAGIAPTGMQAFGTAPIDGAQSRAIAEASPADRPMMYANAGIDPTTVPQSVLNAPQMMTAAQAGLEQNRIFTQALSMVKQGADPSGVFAGAVSMGAITPQQAQAWMADPTFLEPMQEAAKRNLDQRLSQGLLSKARYNYILGQIENQPNVQALTQARTKFLGVEMKYLNPLEMARIGVANATMARLDALTTEESSGSWYQQQEEQGLSLNQQVTQAQKDVTDTQHAYDTYLGIQKTAIANDQDASSVDVGGGVTLGDALAKAQAARDIARKHLNDLLQNGAPRAASNAINNPGSGQRTKEAPQRPPNVPKTAQYGTLSNGKPGWGVPDGHGGFKQYDAKGNPIQ